MQLDVVKWLQTMNYVPPYSASYLKGSSCKEAILSGNAGPMTWTNVSMRLLLAEKAYKKEQRANKKIIPSNASIPTGQASLQKQKKWCEHCKQEVFHSADQCFMNPAGTNYRPNYKPKKAKTDVSESKQ